jgi:hypothetical protein
VKDGALSRNGRFRWSAGWRRWIPTRNKEFGSAEMGPPVPQILVDIRAHPSNCQCPRCFNAGQRVADYLKNRALWSTGGLS